MTDRELLELAAKAAGSKGVWVRWHKGDGNLYVDGLDVGGPPLWNPLQDDGDALRLAVKLHLEVTIGNSAVAASWWDEDNFKSAVLSQSYGFDEEACTATRRAIVRAAAEIGRSMK